MLLEIGKITTRESKGVALTHNEMDMNLKIVEKLIAYATGNNKTEILAIYASVNFNPTLFAVSGMANITNETSVSDSQDNLTYLENPIKISIAEWFSTSVWPLNDVMLQVELYVDEEYKGQQITLTPTSFPFEFIVPPDFFIDPYLGTLSWKLIANGIEFASVPYGIRTA